MVNPMKVVLLENIEKVGKKYDLKEVANGYARNFLIPQGLAKIADKTVIAWAKEQKEKMVQEAEKELEKSGKVAKEIDGIEVEMPVKVGDKGQLFEKINAQKISIRLKEMGYEIDKKRIELSKDIDELGEFEIKIKFEHGLEAQIKLIVSENEN